MKKVLLFALPLFLAACTLPKEDVSKLPAEQQAEVITQQVENKEDMKFVNLEDVSLEEMSGKKHILFFHAEWCSWCRVRERDILKNIDTLPENTKIVKVNFDTQEELRTKYEVASKDQYVFINEDGTFTTRGGADLEIVKAFFTEGTVSEDESPVDGVAGYWDYNPQVVETFVGKKPYALFFHAQWCGSCRKIDKDIRENLESMPSGVSVFKVDYDVEKELAEKYEVKSQHTVVFIDKDENQVKNVKGFGLDDLEGFFAK